MGDVLLHDTTTLRGALQSDGTYDFSSYLDIISQSINGDLAIANIEAPIDANGDGSGISGYPRFNVPRTIVTALKNAGINPGPDGQQPRAGQRLYGPAKHHSRP